MAAVEPIHADLVICRLAQRASPAGEGDAPLRGAALGEVDVLEGDVWIASQFGEIVAVGHGFELRPRLELTDDAVIVDALGMVAIPGLVDCHTHACFAGDRVDEYDRRARGATYEELHAAGGGILSTVEATRAAGLDALTEHVSRHLRWMLEQGTTTVEIKSGYGLDLDTELDMLRAIRSAEAVGSQRRLLDRARRTRGAARGRRRRRVHPALRRRDPSRGRRVGARDRRRRVLRARRLRRRAVAPLPARRRASSGSSAAARRPVHRDRRDPARDRGGARGRSTTSRRPGPRASRRSRRPT